MGGFVSFFCGFKAGFVRAALPLSVFRVPDTLELDCSTLRNSVAELEWLAGSLTVAWLPLLLCFSSLCVGFAFGFWVFCAEAVIVKPARTNANMTKNFICFPSLGPVTITILHRSSFRCTWRTTTFAV